MANRRGHLGMIIHTLIVAGSFPVVAAITPGIDSTVLTFWRFLSATLVFSFMLLFLKEARRRPKLRDLGRYAVVGGSYGFFFILMFEALKSTTPINTSTIYTTVPLMTALLGGLLGEPVRRLQLGVLGLSMAAAVWVIFRGDWERMATLELSRGDMLFFLGTLNLAVHVLALKKLQRNESKVRFTFYSLLTATLALLVATLVKTGFPAFPNASVWLGLAYLAVLSTAVTFWIIQFAAVRLGPNRVVAYTFLTPSVVAGMEWAMGSTDIGWAVLPGIALTLIAVCFLQMSAVSGENPSR
ncbi:DMT family transporter [Desulfococcus sp.]|uniref:DMT family transporter n=1 Tax=Desulfococcus sp. TaxID=2025834 RepID=UPI003D0E5048